MQADQSLSCNTDPLWQRIAAHPIGSPTAALSFTRRLARENLWQADHAAAVVMEYRRFCYLACVHDGNITPPDAVDQAWHLHLTYSRDYWEQFCPHVLRRRLHHGPTEGTPADTARFLQQYAETLDLYQAVFGHPAPTPIWPLPTDRFRSAAAAVRIDGSQFFLVRKRSLPGRLLRIFARPGLR